MILEILASILGVSVSFAAGYLLAREAAHERERAVEKALAQQRLELYAPPYTYQLVEPQPPIGDAFAEKLKTDGQATVMLKRGKTAN